MDKKKQNLFLAVIAVFMIISLEPLVYRLWKMIQLPLEQMLFLPDFWHSLGLLLLVPSLLLAVTLSLPQLLIEDRDNFQRPLALNFVTAGILHLVAAWQSFSVSSAQAGFYTLLAVFSFTAPSLVKQIRTRFGT